MQTFTPFPLRARGLLEIFDAAIKLYKQYFWVLLGWSAIVSLASIFGSLMPLGGMAALFIAPLSIGSVVCCVAAAVRGQNVEFGQCWRFTQPRYWMMLGMQLLASLVGGVILLVLIGITMAIGFGGVFLFRQSSGVVQVVMAIVGFVVLGLITTLIGTVVFSWISLVPIVVCMEEDKRGTMALNRAYEMLRGHWLRITTLMTIVALAMLALFAMLAGLASLLVGFGKIGDMMRGGRLDEAALWIGMGAMGVSYVVLWIIWTPLLYLILSVFYLDIRVRQEALDLEWTAHTTAPPVVAYPTPSGAAPTFIGPTPSGDAAPQREYSPPPPTPNYADENVAPPQNPFGTRPLSDEGDTGSTPDSTPLA
jgi:hypothetical protein